MSETVSRNIVPEIISSSETLPPRDEAVDAFRDEIANLEERVAGAQELPSLGVNADIDQLMKARRERNDILANDAPRLDSLKEGWVQYGGEAIDSAQAGLDALNLQPNASGRLSASDKIRLRAAEADVREARNAFYKNLQEGMAVEPKPELGDDKETAPESSEGVSGAESILNKIKNNPDLLSNPDLVSRLASLRAVAKGTVAASETRTDSEDLREKFEDEKQYIADQKDLADEVKVGRAISIEPPFDRFTAPYSTTGVAAPDTSRPGSFADYSSPSAVTSPSLDSIRPGSSEPEVESTSTEDAAEREDLRKWWKHPVLRLSALLTTEPGSIRERWESAGKGRKAVVTAVIGATAIASFYMMSRHGIHHSGGGSGNVDTSALPGGHGGTPKEQLPLVPSSSGGTVEISNTTQGVHANQGWFEVMQNNKIPANERPALLEKIGPKLAEQGWAYRMPNGEWGVSHTGQLPQSVIELIQKR